MTMNGRTLAITVATLAASVVAAYAGSGHAIHHPHRHVTSRPASSAAAPEALAGARFEAPGAIIEDATIRARHEPGVTTEFDASAKETATGGPVGGIPSSSGGP